jgi:hypothetical protein
MIIIIGRNIINNEFHLQMILQYDYCILVSQNGPSAPPHVFLKGLKVLAQFVELNILLGVCADSVVGAL